MEQKPAQGEKIEVKRSVHGAYRKHQTSAAEFEGYLTTKIKDVGTGFYERQQEIQAPIELSACQSLFEAYKGQKKFGASIAL